MSPINGHHDRGRSLEENAQDILRTMSSTEIVSAAKEYLRKGYIESGRVDFVRSVIGGAGPPTDAQLTALARCVAFVDMADDSGDDDE